MSQLMFETVPLIEAVRDACVLIVVPAEPASSKESQSIAGCPDFATWIEHFEVVEVLHAPTGVELEPGQRIDVRDPYEATMRSVHEAYYREGVGMSPILRTYRPRGELPKDGPRIAFVRPRSNGTWAFSCRRAQESIESRAEALDAIAERRAKTCPRCNLDSYGHSESTCPDCDGPLGA